MRRCLQWKRTERVRKAPADRGKRSAGAFFAGRSGGALRAFTGEGVRNGKTAIQTKAWKTEYAKLTAERKTLKGRYLTSER